MACGEGLNVASKQLSAGKAYACPKCGKPMRPHDGPWDVVHCVSCQLSVDLWYETPSVIDTEEAIIPFKPSFARFVEEQLLKL